MLTACRHNSQNFPNILKIADGLAPIGASASEVGVAWLVVQGPEAIPILGTTKIKVIYPLLYYPTKTPANCSTIDICKRTPALSLSAADVAVEANER
jgi:hypothetical protein